LFKAENSRMCGVVSTCERRACGRSAKMSPQNCSAILTPHGLGSSPRRRRRD